MSRSVAVEPVDQQVSPRARASDRSEDPLLRVAGLRVWLRDRSGVPFCAVDDLSLEIGAGECVALVGESGAGKTSATLAVLGLLEGGARVEGSARLAGRELVGAPEDELRRLRGAEVALVPQGSGEALDPLMRVGAQIVEQLRAHRVVSRAEARDRAMALLGRAGLEDAARVARSYPHELSGGMRQRALIAMALSCEPRLLICDEPTSALDSTVAARIADLLRRLRSETGMGLLLVTHDLGLVSRLADRVAVMRAGRIVERGVPDTILVEPEHPYTASLVAAVPWIDGEPSPGPAVDRVGGEGRG